MADQPSSNREWTDHAIGPWFVRDTPSMIQVCRNSPDMSIVNLPKWEGASDSDRAELLATARLIAAAPDLLRACKMIADMAVSWEPLTPGDIAEVRDAITKAASCPTCNGSGWQTIRCRGGDIDKRACPHCPPTAVSR